MTSRREFIKKASTIMMLSSFYSPFSLGSDKPKKIVLATWPDYHNPLNMLQFERDTGIEVELKTYGSNEEMMAMMEAGTADFDVMVATNYILSTYVDRGLIQPLNMSKLPSFSGSKYEERFTEQGIINNTIYAIPKNWGTTGYMINTSKLAANPTTWKEFWDLSMSDASGKTTVHDYQITTIGNALKYYGYSFNSIDDVELNDAMVLLMKSKPHLKEITSAGADAMRNGAWLSMVWTGDGLLLNQENPAMKYVIGKEGGELWCDCYAIPKGSPNAEAAHALVNYLLEPAVNAREVKFHGYPPIDNRVLKILPRELLDNEIMFPDKELTKNLEFSAAKTLTSQRRKDILAQFIAS